MKSKELLKMNIDLSECCRKVHLQLDKTVRITDDFIRCIPDDFLRWAIEKQFDVYVCKNIIFGRIDNKYAYVLLED